MSVFSVSKHREKKKIMFSQINTQGKKGRGNNQSEGRGHVFGRNQNSDTDQLKKIWFNNTALANGS